MTTRKNTWRTVAALGATAVLLAGCASGGDSAETSGVEITQANATAPATSDLDTLNWNFIGEPPSLSPTFAIGLPAQTITASMCDALTVTDADFGVSPHLAVPTQVDPTTVTLDITDGATFWDGTPVTADDVAFSLTQSMQPSAAFSFVFSYVQSISVTGPLQVTVSFTRPDELFIKELSSPAGMIWQKAYAESQGEAYGTAEGGVMCSGPFKLDSWTPGQFIDLSRNEAYWNDEYRARSASARLTFVTDTNAVVQGLLSGDFDGTFHLPPAAVDALSDTDAGTLISGETMAQAYLTFANADGVTSDIDLRKAILGSLDRQAIADVIYKGAADPAYAIVAPNYWEPDGIEFYEEAYFALEETNRLSVEDAKKLVEGSTYEGQTLTFAIPASNATMALLAQFVQQSLQAIGVTLEILPVEPGQLTTATYTPDLRSEYDLMVIENYGFAKDPLESLAFFLGEGAVYNYTGFSDPEAFAALNKARETFDTEERVGLIVAAQSAWESVLPFTSYVMPRELVFVGDGIGGVTTSGAHTLQPTLALIGAE